MNGLTSPFAGKPMGRHDSELLARVVKALAAPSRLQMISYIHEQGEATVKELSEHTGLAQATTSHHLVPLIKSGLVRREKSGNFAYHTLNPQALADLAGLLNPGGAS